MKYYIKSFSELTNIEVYELLKLRQDVFIMEQACLYADMDNHDQAAAHVLVYDGARLVGCARILDKGTTFAEASIGRVAVAESHRRRGIAQAMLQLALVHLAQCGETVVRIGAQEYAADCYAGVGFVAVEGSEYIEDGIAHVEMVARIG